MIIRQDDSLLLFCKCGSYEMKIDGITAKGLVNINDQYMIFTMDQIDKTVHFSDSTKNFKKSFLLENQQPGIVIYNPRWMQKGLNWINLKRTVVGVNDHIDVNLFTQRISFLLDYNTIAQMPFPNTNQIGLCGIGHKMEYILWRESQGFFSVLNKFGKILTWSLGTSQLMLKEDTKQQFQNYHIYRGSNTDNTYVRNYYNLHDRSLTLLVSNKKRRKQSVSPSTNELSL